MFDRLIASAPAVGRPRGGGSPAGAITAVGVALGALATVALPTVPVTLAVPVGVAGLVTPWLSWVGPAGVVGSDCRHRWAATLLSAAVAGALMQRLTGLSWQALPGLVAVTAVVVVGVRSSGVRSPSVRSPSVGRWVRRAVPRDRPSVALAAVLAPVACILVAWQLDRDGSLVFLRLSFPVIVLGALANAAFEELLWRGAALRLLLRAGCPRGVAVFVQAVSFGLAHLVQGFPSGLVGALLATLFGAAQAVLVLRTRSLVLAVLVHTAVDLTIFVNLFH
ncbi:MAG: CPBP family intramembrane glutamic endopeptidase [Propionibacteriaceae bacterium]